MSAVILNTVRPSGVAAEPEPSAGSRKIAATTDSGRLVCRPRWMSAADFGLGADALRDVGDARAGANLLDEVVRLGGERLVDLLGAPLRLDLGPWLPRSVRSCDGSTLVTANQT